MNHTMKDLENRTRQTLDQVIPALEDAAKISQALRQPPEQAQFFRDKITELRTQRFLVMIYGRFRGGKSTFLNALLGKPAKPVEGFDPAKGALPTDINPCTPCPTRIYYADRPEVFIVYDSGKREAWTFHKFFNEARQARTSEETRAFFRNIERFELGYPSAFCRGGVEIWDAPGTDDNPDMDLKTMALAESADAALFFLTHPAPFSMAEQKYLQDLRACGLTDYITVINGRDGPDGPAMPPTEATKANIWDRIVTHYNKGKGEKGPRYQGQPLESEDIYFLNALRAFEARMNDDEPALRRSGILNFEGRLVQKLESDRYCIHLQRHLDGARARLGALQQEIIKLRSAANADRDKFEREIHEAQRTLEEIGKGTVRIAQIVASYGDKAVLAMQQSLEQLYAEIETDLPAYLKTQPLPSLNKTGFTEKLLSQSRVALGYRKQLCDEAMQIAQAFIEERVTKWRTAPEDQPGATQILAFQVKRMLADLKAEADKIEGHFEKMQYSLTGLEAGDLAVDANLEGISLANRVTATVLGILTMDPTMVASGATQGWEGVFNGLLAQLAVTVPLIFIFNLSLPFVVPIAWAAALGWNLLRPNDVENKVKEKVVDRILHGYPPNPETKSPGFGGLAKEPFRQRDAIAKAVRDKFDLIEKTVVEEFDRAIASQKANLQEQHALTMQGATQREQTLQELARYDQEVQGCQLALQQALVAARQT